MFGVAAVELIARDAKFADVPEVEWFDNLGKSMFTLFQISTFDDWAPLTKNLMNASGGNHGWVAILFVIFIFIVSFVLYSLITAIIIQKAFEVVHKDDEAIGFVNARNRQKEIKGILSFK